METQQYGQANKRVLKLACKVFRNFPILIIATFVAYFIVGPLAALSTKYLGALVNEAATAYGTNALSGVFRLCLYVLSAAVASFAAMIIGAVCEGKLRISLEERIRANLMGIAAHTDYLTFLSEDYQQELSTAGDGFTMELFYSFSSLFNAFGAAVTLISYTAVAAKAAGWIAIVAAALTVSAAIFIKLWTRKKKYMLVRRNRKLKMRMDYISGLYRDTDAYAEMKLFGTKDPIDSLFSELHSQYQTEDLDVRVKNAKHMFLLAAIMGTITFLSIILCFATRQITDAGSMTVIIMSFAVLLGRATSLGASISGIGSLGMYAKAYLEFTDKYDSKTMPFEIASGAESPVIDFKDLHFSYGDINVLKGVNIRVEPGQMVAFVGENGSGKTTLAGIILGLIEKDAGHANVYGRDAYLSRKTGALDSIAVFQQFGKYDGHTVAENISFGDPFDQERIAAMDDFFGKLDMNEMVGNEFDGRDFSGGEWQKIVLARCTASKAPLIILDEPTAALDPMAEAEVFERFMEANRGKTAVLITHRLGAVRKADVIFVLKDGVIEERGTHDELMQRNGYYSEMFRAQAQWYVTDGGEGGDAQ